MVRIPKEAEPRGEDDLDVRGLDHAWKTIVQQALDTTPEERERNYARLKNILDEVLEEKEEEEWEAHRVSGQNIKNFPEEHEGEWNEEQIRSASELLLGILDPQELVVLHALLENPEIETEQLRHLLPVMEVSPRMDYTRSAKKGLTKNVAQKIRDQLNDNLKEIQNLFRTMDPEDFTRQRHHITLLCNIQALLTKREYKAMVAPQHNRIQRIHALLQNVLGIKKPEGKIGNVTQSEIKKSSQESIEREYRIVKRALPEGVLDSLLTKGDVFSDEERDDALLVAQVLLSPSRESSPQEG